MKSADDNEPFAQNGPDNIPVAPSPQVEPQPQRSPTRIDRTRAGSVWVSLSVGGVFLVVLLVFVVQNTTSVRLGFLGWHFVLPVGVSILVAAVAGLLVMAVAGGVRIIQLRQKLTRLTRPRKLHPSPPIGHTNTSGT
ncbi:hypothetical protein JMUB6875_03150 [Nocardia sp. JMUB6875]|uniref:LapA family protein n=1 Tax=Nocardia sp. JMUB6875 TaxID=3158170 RepID=UPI0032E5FB35